MSKSARKAAARAKKMESYKNAQPNLVLWGKWLDREVKRSARLQPKKG